MKTTYHTNIKLAFLFGMLDNRLRSSIPSSTLHNWKGLDLNKIFGLKESDLFDKDVDTLKLLAHKKRLLQIVRACLVTEKAIKTIFCDANFKSAIRAYSSLIIGTVEKVQTNIGLLRALEIFGISCQQFHFWKKKVRCTSSPLSLCRKIYYNQLSVKEVCTVKQFLSDVRFFHWPAVSVYFLMLRERAAFMSLSTFYRYASLLGFTKHRRFFRNKNNHVGVRADRPFRVLHMDITEIRCLNNEKVYLSLIIDNFSRAILGWKASLTKSSATVLENLMEVIQKYQLRELDFTIDLFTDDGSENKSKVDDFLSNPEINIRKLIALIDICFSNSMFEAVNKKIKHEYLFRKNITGLDYFEKHFAGDVEDYMNRPHGKLNCFTPFEALHSEKTDRHSQFSDNIQLAIMARMVENRNSSCEECEPEEK